MKLLILILILYFYRILQNSNNTRHLDNSFFFAHFSKINSKNFFGQTPLHYVIIEERDDFIKLLLNCGADVDSTDSKGGSPLGLASHEQREIIRSWSENYHKEMQQMVSVAEILQVLSSVVSSKKIEIDLTGSGDTSDVEYDSDCVIVIS